MGEHPHRGKGEQGWHGDFVEGKLGKGTLEMSVNKITNKKKKKKEKRLWIWECCSTVRVFAQHPVSPGFPEYHKPAW